MIWLAEGVSARAIAQRGCVFFDFDGTLGNTLQAIEDTARATLTGWGLTPEQIGDVRRLIGPPFPRAFTEVYGFSPQEAEAVTAAYRDRYDGLGPDAYPAYDGVAAMLEALHRAGRWLCLTTSKKESLAVRMAAEDGLMGYFDAVRGQRGPGHDTKTILVGESVEAAGGDPRRCLMVGDRYHDMEGARAWDVPGIGVTWGAGSFAELRDAGAAAVVDTPDELRRLLLGQADGSTSASL